MQKKYVSFILVFLALSAFAANLSRARLDSCIGYYEMGLYSRAVDSLRATIPSLNGLEEAEAYKYLAFSYVMLDMISTAKKNFKVLLEKYPQATIDTVTVPPNITVVFNQAKSETERSDSLGTKHGSGLEKSKKAWYSRWYVWTPLALMGAGGGIYFAVLGTQGEGTIVPDNMREVQIDGQIQ